jgi:hypothetical protein
MFQKPDLLLPSGDGRETPTLLGPLERARAPSPHLKMETVSETLHFLVI